MPRILFLTSLLLLISNHALADTFGSGANSFNIDFVTIGNPGNAPDTNGTPAPFAGSVPTTYRIGTYEVSRDMINKSNAIGNLGIPLNDMTSFGGNGVNRPATGVSWNEAARFMNWLNTSTGSPPAYKFALQPGDSGYIADVNIQLWTSSDAGYDSNNRFRNKLARYFLPSFDEWYKAAYYNPTGSRNATTPGYFYDYPTGSDVGNAPTPVASGTAAGTAVYDIQYDGQSGPADITLAGGLSPYGTMGQGGNVDEWQETETDLVNNSPSSDRGVRGGTWLSDSHTLLSQFRGSLLPSGGNSFLGFRVASAVPEPSTLVLAVGIFAPLAAYRRRRG